MNSSHDIPNPTNFLEFVSHHPHTLCYLFYFFLSRGRYRSLCSTNLELDQINCRLKIVTTNIWNLKAKLNDTLNFLIDQEFYKNY